MSRKMTGLFVLFAVLFVSLIMNTVYTYNQSHHAIKSNLIYASSETIGQAAQSLDATMDTYEQLTRSLVLNPVLRDLIHKMYAPKNGTAEANQAFQMVEGLLTSAKNASRMIDRIALLNTQRSTGQANFDRKIPIVFSKPGNYISLTPESDVLEKALIRADGEPVWFPTRGRSVFSPVESTLVTAVPVLTHGRLLKNIPQPEQQFAVFLELKVQALDAIFAQIGHAENMELTVVDDSNRIVYAADHGKIGSDFGMLLPSGKHGVIELDASEQLLIYQTSSRTGWKIAGMMSTSALYGDIRENFRLNMAAFFIMLLMIGLTVLFLRRFMNTHKALQKSAEEIRQKNELLTRQYDQLEVQHRELERLSQIKERVMANTSHELRTPLHSIIGFAESMAAQTGEQMSADMKNQLQLIISSGRRLNVLVDDILDMSRLNDGQQMFQPEPVYVRQVIRELIELAGPLVKDSHIKLFEEDRTEAAVYADPVRFRQILWNLITNAIKFTPRGMISIRVRPAGRQQVWIEVKDTGKGIPAEWKDRIFEPFSQVDASDRRESGGFGLGLSIVRSLVEQQGGMIAVESEPDKGSTFSFCLPRYVDLSATGTDSLFR